MHAPPAWRTWLLRFVGLGLPRLLLVLAMVLVLLALATPLWAFTEAEGNDWTTSTYSWTGWSSVSFRDGVCCRSVSEPYSWPGFDQTNLAASVGNSYLFIVVFLIALLAVAGLFSVDIGRRLPSAGFLVVAVLVVGFALLALFYPLVTVPSAAAADLQISQITGFWGSTTTPGPPVVSYTWGAGLAWWLLLVAVILGTTGGTWPYLKAVREAPQAPPRPWHASR